jgi:hypothetical protein
MPTSDRFRLLRGLGLAVASLLVISGAVFASQSGLPADGDQEKADESMEAMASPSSSFDSAQELLERLSTDASADASEPAQPMESAEPIESTEPIETPEARATQDDAAVGASTSEHEEGSESPEASESEAEHAAEPSEASESPKASASPNDHGGNHHD